jgi:hypothetical protein
MEWFRKFINDMVTTSNLSHARAASTWSVVKILAAKAEQNTTGCLSVCEFDVALRVIRQPAWQSSLEEELAWCIFDIDGVNFLNLDDFHKLRNLWASLGKVCSDAQAAAVERAAEREDRGAMSRERYQAWLRSMKASAKTDRPGTPLPPAAELAIQPQHMTFTRQAAPQDHLRRSTDVKLLSLARVPINRAAELLHFLNMRGLKPSRPSTARSRRAVNADDGFDSCMPSPRAARPPRTVAARGASDAQAVRKARLQPYMEVKAPYFTKEGETKYHVGTLMSGWGQKNTSTVIPHSEAPGKSSSKRKCTTEGVPHVQRGKEFVRVLMHGIERWVPRDAVLPVKLA